MPNQALDANPPTGSVQHITVRGSDWLWAVFAIMTFTDIVVFFWQFTLPRGQRVFHQLAMYVRYIDWVITTPSLLLTLVLASGLPLSDIIALCYFDLVMIVTGLVGALVVSSYKWGFYAFGCAALFYIWWVLAGPARSSAGALGPGYKSAFTKSAAILSFLWLLYPIAWGLADGGNVITPDSEMIFYGVLDVLAKPVFTIFHLYSLSKLDLSLLQLSSGKFSTSGGVFDREKHAAAGIPATVGTNNASSKGGFFGRRAQRETAAAEPRISGATAVNA
ncbi:uncharacterized protein IL334_001206 [Kwoniella shivajii]|uniref:Opsin n=1 Tax=Kwoniella shivajii TaxID=564305 RepID=A0ABZ1CRM4_9TREE|nr:hypothetical protein IL334_001206 [Kwoniella shivajii]